MGIISRKNMVSNKTVVLINVKDRPTELAMLLQSLRTQTTQNFDILILDDCSSTPLQNYHFLNCIIQQIKQEGHRLFLKRTDFSEGVAKARQKIVDWAGSIPFKWKYYLRVDDDVVLEPDYIDRLFKVLDAGYDLASGVTVPMTGPSLKRDPKHLHGVINRVILDKEGNYIWNGDDCGMMYTESIILPAHHFRSCALYRAEIHDKANYWPTPLSWHGFREEQIFSYRVLMEGYKIGVDTQAVNYHQMTPSGGERPTGTPENTNFNQEQLENFTKINQDKLRKIFNFGKKWHPKDLELKKSCNLTMRPK